MTNTTIFAIIAFTSILVLGTSIAQAADHGDAPLMAQDDGADVPAIPEWVQFTMQAYLDKQISEREILDAFLFLENNGIMHKSKEAAQQMAEIRAENTALKKKLQTDGIVGPNTWGAIGTSGDTASADEQGRVKVQFHWDEETEQEALHHLRKAYDLNPALQTRVVQFDSNHDKWIDVLSIDWGSTSSKDCSIAEGSSDENSSCWIRVSQTHAGDPDRPIVTGRVYNSGEEIYPDEYGTTSSSGDMTIKGKKIHENAPAHDGGAVIVYTGLESASETVHDLVSNGETSTTGWEEGIAAFTSKNYGSESTASGNKSADTLVVQELLNGFIFAIDKEILVIEGEVAILEELMDMYTSTSTRSSTQYGESDFDFISRNIEKIDTKIQSLQTGLRVLDEKLLTIGDDAQLANIDLQNSLQKQQQTLQTISNTSKMLHDTAMSIIRKIG